MVYYNSIYLLKVKNNKSETLNYVIYFFFDAIDGKQTNRFPDGNHYVADL